MILKFWNIWSLNLNFLCATDPTFFYPGVLVIHTGEREIGSVSGRLPDNPGELAVSADRRDVAPTPRRNLANVFFLKAVKLMFVDLKM